MNVPYLPAFFATCIEQDEQSGHPWDATQVHSSDLGVAIGESCPRALWLRVRGAPAKPDSPGKRAMFNKARMIHVQYADWMERRLPEATGGEWLVVAVEEVVGGEGVGRLDVAIRNRAGECLIVDFKSMRGSGFPFMDHEGSAKPAHVIQVQSYIKAYDAVGGIIVYTDREGSNGWRQFFVERDDARVPSAWATARGYAESQEPAPKIAPKVGKPRVGTKEPTKELPWQCDYCAYLGDACTGALVLDGPLDWKPEERS